MDYQVVVLAAGQGKRMGADTNKVLLDLAGAPVIVRTLRVFETDPMCSGIVIVTRADEADQFRALVQHYHLEKVRAFAEGGKERQESVCSGLERLPQDPEMIVLIHDGARPFITHACIAKAVESAQEYGAALLAVPVKDTIKQAAHLEVEKTLERKSLWAAQTPQAFRLSVIREAHQQSAAAHFMGTDDASLVERLGMPVAVVEGSYRNIKLTTPEDLLIAQLFMEREEE
ncbi:2-C-methyl-D-erythritol 4-phosphate cytidylyltransferase [Sporolactobacillus inulinus]|jgi:2-C-methyl-D-erythritol 4-phosphate cytidylyltransferase|uniref:2-C-methyl-D-erythritol 4-phosphate cytidylyltransferase n=2 Tax=Sporolactobacillus inulinus TaxID=2078 RepID=A0A4Y1ZFK8_9BACL|nr:2-C-methyl-D-erythritol 4-phosphate cytidylyltransferase [Sporolactobacillus inulinus]KLI02490.1 2-C-methyl-D-erythritol 4-phosphate cytidylyltransferase [Sporolactobacillus inulinus CASD]GAY77773.1 2-C-methyl-d-erythritol 4-phosphate cytidylyltransferase [Sporolactobacillus inulinus]GEB77078.1 2-C-methyl-D-erythritol 4-phosphate cytidylyltransferase [Sporolactobacillus inulinus]